MLKSRWGRGGGVAADRCATSIDVRHLGVVGNAHGPPSRIKSQHVGLRLTTPTIVGGTRYLRGKGCIYHVLRDGQPVRIFFPSSSIIIYLHKPYSVDRGPSVLSTSPLSRFNNSLDEWIDFNNAKMAWQWVVGGGHLDEVKEADGLTNSESRLRDIWAEVKGLIGLNSDQRSRRRKKGQSKRMAWDEGHLIKERPEEKKRKNRREIQHWVFANGHLEVDM